jgi:rhodanese-related sulfurtransferase
MSIFETIIVLVLGAIVTVLWTAWSRYRRAGIKMQISDFFKRLVRAKGFRDVSAGQLHHWLRSEAKETTIVDLRTEKAFAKDHIPGSQHSPFDDFLREVVVESRFADQRNNNIVIVCDTGQMSRVVAEIMGEDEGFTRVFSLRGGIKAWRRWQQEQARLSSRSHRGCCGVDQGAAA